MTDSIEDVIVVGGGIAGLTAAYEVQQRGFGVRLLEASARPGGAIVTDRIAGFTIDAGPDALLIQKPAAVALCKELLGGTSMNDREMRRVLRKSNQAAQARRTTKGIIEVVKRCYEGCEGAQAHEMMEFMSEVFHEPPMEYVVFHPELGFVELRRNPSLFIHGSSEEDV